MSGSAIKSVCVIGAGTMGAGIAAQVANAGLDVLLLDIASKDGSRDEVAERALERIKKSDPPLLMSAENAERISLGNIEDDLAAAGQCDWVVEAIVERLEIKRDLYRNLYPLLKSWHAGIFQYVDHSHLIADGRYARRPAGAVLYHAFL